ncbi:major facilitator superfamily-domain-containing protein [Achaetomium macrosporum]|uniref:Major facilitator superfamily-domain-containing protein n=1 Tax=Achaetomium macrosporum TaxID=79813 RepID=A0AAN7CCR2_9PEZI|nr:major facilitator superfamily-domain-containing protein [Achaetomium macrosporum]
MIATGDDDPRTLLIPGQCDIREYGAVPTAVPDSPESSSASDTASDVQDGVRQIEAVSRTWSKWGLVIAYMSIFLMAFTISLEGQVTYSLAAFAVSSFNNHSLLSTVYVVQGVVNAVIKPPMAKIADVFGRLEAFCICILLCVLGYIQMAASQNVETYASAQIFYSAGSTGLQILQQVFIADTSDFLNRALFSSLPDSPFLVTVWIGPAIAAAILANTSWRVGYAVWALILPLAFLPLAMSLFLNGRKVEKMGLLVKKRRGDAATNGRSSRAAAKRLFHDLDIGGTLLLSGGLSLILIPLTLVSRSPSGWHNPKLLVMILTGLILLILFPLWESRPHLAPYPLLPLPLLKSRTFCAGCALGFFYFGVFYIAVQPYFYSYLLVALNLPVSQAGPITQTFSFASTIAALLASLIIRRLSVPRPRPFIRAGAVLYTLAIVVLLRTRTRTASIVSLFAAQTGLGAGAGLMHVATQLVVQAAASSYNQHHGHGHPQQYVGVATASFLTLVQVGAAVGSAVSGAVWGRLVPAKLTEYLPEHVKGEAKKIYASVVVACSYAWGSPEREAIARSYQETITVLLWVALVACGPMLGMAALVGDYRLDGTGRGDAGRMEVRESEARRSRGTWWSKWRGRPKGRTASFSVSSVHG